MDTDWCIDSMEAFIMGDLSAVPCGTNNSAAAAVPKTNIVKDEYPAMNYEKYSNANNNNNFTNSSSSSSSGSVGTNGMPRGGSFGDLLKLLQQTTTTADDLFTSSPLLSVTPAPFHQVPCTSMPFSAVTSASLATVPSLRMSTSTSATVPTTSSMMIPTSSSTFSSFAPSPMKQQLQQQSQSNNYMHPPRRFVNPTEDAADVFTLAKAKWTLQPPSSPSTTATSTSSSSSASTTSSSGVRVGRSNSNSSSSSVTRPPKLTVITSISGGSRKRKKSMSDGNGTGRPRLSSDECDDDDDDLEDDDDDDDGSPLSSTLSICGFDDEDSLLTFKRARNREHAKRSRMRKKVKLDGLEEQLLRLRRENMRLKSVVKRQLPDKECEVLSQCEEIASNMSKQMDATPRKRSRGRISKRGTSCLAGIEDKIGNTVPSALELMEQDVHQMKLLSEYQHNIFLTCPQPNGSNPIVFASTGFLKLIGYTAPEVIGRDIDFLHGVGTDHTSIDIINNNRRAGRDSSVCFLCYRKDRKPFWLQLYLSPLRNVAGEVVNFVGVCAAIEEMSASEFRRRLHRVPLPEDLLLDDDAPADCQ